MQRALHHEGWHSQVLEDLQWERAQQRHQQLLEQGEVPLCIWDSSVVEKPESEQLQGLSAVRSARVRRLARSRKGVFNRPAGKPVSVRGFEWESVLLVGHSGGPEVVTMKWWSRHQGISGHQRQRQVGMRGLLAARWGRRVRHLFDRGDGHGPGCGLWGGIICASSSVGRRATSSWTPPVRSAQPGRSRGANEPGARPSCSGRAIVGSIAVRACSPGQLSTRSIVVPSPWWSSARAKDASRGSCSPMSR